MSLDQKEFLAGEAIVALVRVSNQSGQPLDLGEDPEWISFQVESKDGFLVPKAGLIKVEGRVRLESAQVARMRVDLSPGYLFDRPGSYQLAALVKIPQWRQQVASPPVNFSVVQGVVIWEQEFGVPVSPVAPATNTPPEMRKYALLQANYQKKLQLYARVTDASGGRIIKVFPIGPLLSFSKPEAQIDRFSNLHVLHQDGAKTFCYAVLNCEGRMVVRETYEYTATRPRLKAGEAGRFSVQGGQRKISSNDLPPPSVQASTNELVLPNP